MRFSQTLTNLGMLFGTGLLVLSQEGGRRSASLERPRYFEFIRWAEAPDDNREAYPSPGASKLMKQLAHFLWKAHHVLA